MAKKMVAISLVLVMVLCMVACSNEDGGKGGLSGKYMLQSMSYEGMTVTSSQLAEMGMGDAYLEFRDDGTAVMYFEGESEELKVDQNAKTLTDTSGEAVSYKLDGKTVTISQDGMELVFQKG
ncbi:MAG: hypothetical protein IJW45_07730 [Oscillospiraceae bacterium]|nr:hypothetical protein [Oscillospiraceae bacterium]